MDVPPDHSASVAPVVVQAARLPSAAGDPAYSIIRIDPARLKASDQLDRALAAAPGFSLFRRVSSLGANPTTQGASLRGIAGSGASRALVTLDGVPQNDPFGGWVIWTGLPTEAISGATLVRGAGAGPYGAGALTGAVALEQPSQIEGGAAGDLEIGDPGYGRVAAITELDDGPARVFLDASGESSRGWIPVIQGRGAADRPLTLHDWSAAERTEISLGDKVLSERVAAFEEDRGAGALFADSRARGAQASLTLVGAPDSGRGGWRLQGWADVSDLRNSSASVSADRNTATLANNQYATPALGVGFNAALRRSDRTYSWELGADVRDVSGESKEDLYSRGALSGHRVSGGGELVAGVYAEGSRTLGSLLLTGGFRLDDWETYDSNLVQNPTAHGATTPLSQRAPDRGGVVSTGRLGVRRDLSQALYLRAAAYAGFRPATLNELHRSFRVGNDVTVANSQLTPERFYGAEAGLGGRGVIHWDLDAFYNQLANAITNVTVGHGPGNIPGFPVAGFVPAGGTLYERENAGAVNAYGIEGEADAPLGRALDLHAAFSWTHARVDGGGQAPQLTGLKPAETPTVTVTAGASWRPLDRLTLSADLRYEGVRYDDDQNTRRIDAGTSLDARAEWTIAPTVSAYVQVDNLTDADIQTGRSAPTTVNPAGVVAYDAPRLIRMGFSLRR